MKIRIALFFVKMCWRKAILFRAKLSSQNGVEGTTLIEFTRSNPFVKICDYLNDTSLTHIAFYFPLLQAKCYLLK